MAAAMGVYFVPRDMMGEGVGPTAHPCCLTILESSPAGIPDGEQHCYGIDRGSP